MVNTALGRLDLRLKVAPEALETSKEIKIKPERSALQLSLLSTRPTCHLLCTVLIKTMVVVWIVDMSYMMGCKNNHGLVEKGLGQKIMSAGLPLQNFFKKKGGALIWDCA